MRVAVAGRAGDLARHDEAAWLQSESAVLRELVVVLQLACLRFEGNVMLRAQRVAVDARMWFAQTAEAARYCQ